MSVADEGREALCSRLTRIAELPIKPVEYRVPKAKIVTQAKAHSSNERIRVIHLALSCKRLILLPNVRRHRHRTAGATNARERSDQHSA